MSTDTLVQKLKEIQRTNDFHEPLEPLKARLEEVERVFELGRVHLQYFEFIGTTAKDAIETAIEVLFRCGDFEQALEYSRLYGVMQTQQRLN